MTPMPEIWTPSQCNQRVKSRVRDLADIRVQGEVSGARLSRGHLYFDLKDRDGKIRCTLWRSSLAQVEFQPRDGDEVICRGALDVWVAGGSYALNVRRVERAGLGRRYLALQRLTAQLKSEGLLDAERKRALPAMPRVVGLVTAPGSAALRDMVRMLHDRFPVHIIISPTRVQGAGAAREIAHALRALAATDRCDVIIVGRGGGSAEDLWAFNEEEVARAIAACDVPVVSAVGHETDVLLSDHVADRRASTPTAAAEMVVPEWRVLADHLRLLRQRLAAQMDRGLRDQRRALAVHTRGLLAFEGQLARQQMRQDLLAASLERVMTQTLRLQRHRIQQLLQRLARVHPARQLTARRSALHGLIHQLGREHQRALHREANRLQRLNAQLLALSSTLLVKSRSRHAELHATLMALDPKAPLRRGYGIVRDVRSGVVVTDARRVDPGARLEVLLHHGALDVVVESTSSVEG